MSRVLVAIPAYNEQSTIEDVVRSVRAAAPMFDLLVVNDGSRDGTGDVLARSGATTATHLCNLGYGRAIQTAIMYARRCGYEALITFDADGQHQATDLVRLYEAFRAGHYDLLIGSRFMTGRRYGTEPFVRGLGMRVFSRLIAWLTAESVYDTSSGMKVIDRRVFDALAARPFVDFHAEAITYLIRLGHRIGEHPITVTPRRHGESMYTSLSVLKYPLKVSFLILVNMLEARRQRGLGERAVSYAGVALVDLAGLLLIVWLFQLVRRDRLYVGYGVIFVLVTVAGAAMISIPGALDPLSWIAGVTVGAPALVGLALAFMFLMLVYTLSQLTLLSNRLTRLVQELAIRQAMTHGRNGPEPPAGA